jgi:T5SS/PEP-CTERM-associated repeat protein
LSYPGLSPAADSFWSSNTGGNYTNTANWLGAAVPATGDNANFTNNASYTINWRSDVTNSNAFFNAQSGTVTLNVSPQTWSLLNQLVVGQSSATGSVTHSSGTIVLTNAAGLGALVVGEAGRGTFTLAGGTVTAHRLFATNVTATATNSFFLFNGGTLTTLGGSEWRAGLFQDGVGTVLIGSTATPATWNMPGGSNTIAATTLKLGRLSDGNRLIVSGTNTVLSYTGGNFQIGEVGSRNQMVISNGARVNMTFTGSGAFIRMSGSGQSNSVIVTGPNSLWNMPNGELGIGRGTGRDQLIITDGGEVRSLNGQIGVLANSANSVVLNNGTISFRNITDANVFSIVKGSGFRITNMAFFGNNAFRLNNASNATGLASYTFNTGLGSTNYSRLELQNNARWRLWLSPRMVCGGVKPHAHDGHP